MSFICSMWLHEQQHININYYDKYKKMIKITNNARGDEVLDKVLKVIDAKLIKKVLYYFPLKH